MKTKIVNYREVRTLFNYQDKINQKFLDRIKPTKEVNINLNDNLLDIFKRILENLMDDNDFILLCYGTLSLLRSIDINLSIKEIIKRYNKIRTFDRKNNMLVVTPNMPATIHKFAAIVDYGKINTDSNKFLKEKACMFDVVSVTKSESNRIIAVPLSLVILSLNNYTEITGDRIIELKYE